MEFTESFYERRLSHILTAVTGAAVSRAERRRRGVSAGSFGRKRRENSRQAATLPGRVAALSHAVDALVIEHGSKTSIDSVPIAEIGRSAVLAPASDWKRVCYYMMSGALDPALTDFLYSALTPGSVFLDLGASLGAYALLAAELVRDGMVFALESDPEARHWLLRNLSDFGGNVRIAGDPLHADEVVEPGRRVDVARIGATAAIMDAIAGMRRIRADNPRCRIVVDYCAALHPGGPAPDIAEALTRSGFCVYKLDHGVAPSPAGSIAGAFSACLLLESEPT
jgi:hypothetical protein